MAWRRRRARVHRLSPLGSNSGRWPGGARLAGGERKARVFAVQSSHVRDGESPTCQRSARVTAQSAVLEPRAPLPENNPLSSTAPPHPAGYEIGRAHV